MRNTRRQDLGNISEAYLEALVQAHLGHADISTTRKIHAHTKTAVLKQFAAHHRSPAQAVADLERQRDEANQTPGQASHQANKLIDL